MQASAAVKLDQFGRGYLAAFDNHDVASRYELQINDYSNVKNSDSDSSILFLVKWKSKTPIVCLIAPPLRPIL